MRALRGAVLSIRPTTAALVVLGLALLALGIWVEDRAAVAAPLVVLGALIVVAGILVQSWMETVHEMSLGREGLTLKRQLPSAEELTEAGLPPEVAAEIERWMTTLAEALPQVIDSHVNRVLEKRRERDRMTRLAAERFVDFQRRQRGDDA
jgi:hypothetical protein